MSLSSNERSWAIDVISKINELAHAYAGPIRKAGGEHTLPVGSTHLYPDVLLFGDSAHEITLQGWELKMPDTPIINRELFDNAVLKAEALGVNSFVLWNVKDAALYVKDPRGLYILKKNWPDITEIQKREEVKSKEENWIKALRILLSALNEYFQSGTLRGRTIDDSLSDNTVVEIVLEHANTVEAALLQVSKNNMSFDNEVTAWWQGVRAEYANEQLPHLILARMILTNWLNKLIFAHLLKSHLTPAYAVEKITHETTPEEALSIFARISEECNFLNVFKRSFGDNVLTPAVWSILTQFNSYLSNFSFKGLGADLVHALLAQTVAIARRKVCGQYATPPALADLLVRLTIANKEKMFYDPCSGTGTIARAAYELKLEYGVASPQASSTIWASDKFSLPIQLSTMALLDPENIGIPLQVFQADLTSVKVGLPIRLINPMAGTAINRPFPEIDCIAANPPFIRQETIRETNSEVLKINFWIKERIGNELKLAGKSDLMAYIPFWLWGLLADNGRLGLILPNAWLGANWGHSFRQLLNKFFHIQKIIISAAGRWFQNADVVTTLIILTKRDPLAFQPEIEVTTFCTTLQPIELWVSSSMQQKELAAAINLSQERTGSLTVQSYSALEMRQAEALGVGWTALFADIRFLSAIQGSLAPLAAFFHVARGERRGHDPLFFPKGRHNIIEEDYLRTVLKSPRGILGLVADPDGKAFCCAKTITELTSMGHKGAISWIGQFENGTNEKGKPLTDSLRRKNLHWYQMDDKSIADFVVPVNPDQRLFIARMRQQSFVNQRLIRFTLKKDQDAELLHALLNSVLGLFYIEALGFGRGLAVLDINASKLGKNMRILDPHHLEAISKSRIIHSFQPLLHRHILPLTEELEQKDRINFDTTVLEAFQIESFHSRIVSALKTLYSMRRAARGVAEG